MYQNNPIHKINSYAKNPRKIKIKRQNETSITIQKKREK